MFCCVHAVLGRKTEAIYSKFLGELKKLLPGWSPGVILMDFELAVVNAFRVAFPNATIKGCYFHENSREGNHPGNIDYDTFIAYNFKR